MDNENNIYNNTIITPDYLQELFRDKKLIQTNGIILKHGNILLDREIARVKECLLRQKEPACNELECIGEGRVITKQEKIFLPVKENPNYNFVGRILGPRGYTAKQLEQKLDCKIMIRGKGSMRDHNKEEQNRGKPNWEHLQQELHVLVSITDYENRINQKLAIVREAITKFIDEGLNTPESQDTLKQMQLMELSILNENDRLQQQQRQQVFMQQSAALQLSPNILNQNIIKFPIMPIPFSDPSQDLTQLLSNQDPLQFLSLNSPWTSFFGNPLLHQENTLSSETMLPITSDHNASLLSLLNNTNNIAYMNYGIPGPLKLRPDQRPHPYSRGT